MGLQSLLDYEFRSPNAGHCNWTLRGRWSRIVTQPKSDLVDQQGCFHWLPSRENTCLAGLGRNGHWLWVEIKQGPLSSLTGNPKLAAEWVCLINVLRPTTAELAELLGSSFENFWYMLSDQVKLWVNERRRRLSQAEGVHEKVGLEDTAFNLFFGE